MTAKETILYFGSFNPPHNGHTEVARYVVERGLCDELWFVVSPRNPLKSADGLAPDTDRLEMMRIAACEELGGLPAKVCDVEFSLPRPSYTVDTMRELGRRFPERRFALLGGTDILEDIGKWKDSELLMAEYRFYIYPRDGYTVDDPPSNVILMPDAPRLRFSSTDVRDALHGGGDISEMVCPGVREYIEKYNLYG